MDIILPLSDTSVHHNIELRYALRSFEQNFIGIGEMFVIGLKPSWLTNVIHIPAEDRGGARHREENIYKKIITACENAEISDPFLFVNDDHFILKRYNTAAFPYYFNKPVNSISTDNPVKNTLNNTVHLIGGAMNYDVHCPIIYNKQKFIDAFKDMEWPPFGYCIKSVYCYKNNIQGEQIEDCKIDKRMTVMEIKEKIYNKLWFSIGDQALEGGMKQVLQQLLPKKSKYES